MGDLSLLVKCGVQFGLFGGAILHLGTERHHERYLRDVASFDLPGCFAMTETGHGSNVQALETTATYDAEREEFVVHTPDDDARKDYIGNAARDGRMAVVFAQLHTGGEERGVHALLVPIRDEDGEPLPGVRLEDCGAKLGLNGVDNGRIWFDHVRVPRENLLDHYAQVEPDGTYFSPIENPTKRFFTMIGTLIQGRISVCGASISALQGRADDRRPARAGAPPVRPARAARRRCCWTTARTSGGCFRRWRRPTRCRSPSSGSSTSCTRCSPTTNADDRSRRELETLAAGVKAVATWHASDTIEQLPRGLWRRGLPALQPLRRAEGRHRRLHDLRGRQHDPAAARRQEPADRLQGRVRRARPARDGAVRRRPGARRADRAHRAAQARRLAAARAATTTPTCSTRKTQLELFRWRHEHLLAGAARRLKGGIDAGRDPFAVLVDCQDHVIEAARSWVDLVVLESFAATATTRVLDDALQPLRAARDRGRARLLPGARAAVGGALEGGPEDRQRALRRAAPARPRTGRRLRRAGERARRRARRGRESGSPREDPAPPRRAGAADARHRAGAVRRARLRGRDDGRGRRAGRGHQAAALQLLRQQGAALPGVHEARRRRAGGVGRLRRPGRRRRSRRAARRDPRVLRLPGLRRRGVAGAARRDAARRRRDRAAHRRVPRADGGARHRVAARSAPRAAPSSRSRSPSSAPPRRWAAGGCAPASCPRSAPPNS